MTRSPIELSGTAKKRPLINHLLGFIKFYAGLGVAEQVDAEKGKCFFAKYLSFLFGFSIFFVHLFEDHIL